MPPTPAALADEIANGPLAESLAPLVAAGRDADVAAALNVKQYAGPVPIVEVSSLFINEGITGLLKAALDNSETPGMVRVLCHLALTLVEQDYRLTTCDTAAPQFATVAGGLVVAGLMTQTQVDTLVGMSANRSSRAEVLWGDGVRVTADNVAKALRG